MFDPKDGLATPVNVDDVHPAVCVDVHGQMRITIEAPADFSHGANEMFFPSRRLVPPAATKDIELTITIDVNDGHCAVLGLGVDCMYTKLDIRSRRRQRTDEQSGKEALH